MKITKKILSLATAALTLPVLALASSIIPNPPSSTNILPDFGTMFVLVLGVIWPIVGGLAIVMLVVAGITLITANGDPERIKTARNAVIWAIAGIVVAIAAYSIPTIIRNIFPV